MKTASKKLLTVTSAVITALSVYSQNAAALNLSNPTIGMAYINQGSFWGLPTSINAQMESGTTATVALLVEGNVEIPLPSDPTFITARGNTGVSGGNRNIQGVAVHGQSTLNLGAESVVTSDGGGVFVYESSVFNADKLTITAGEATEISLVVPNRSGLGISDYSKANLGENSKIFTSGNRVSGVIAEKSSEFKAEGLLVNVTSTITDPTYTAAGVQSNSSNVFLGSDSKIITNGYCIQ